MSLLKFTKALIVEYVRTKLVLAILFYLAKTDNVIL